MLSWDDVKAHALDRQATSVGSTSRWDEVHRSVHARTSLQNQRTSVHAPPPSGTIWFLCRSIPHSQQETTAARRAAIPSAAGVLIVSAMPRSPPGYLVCDPYRLAQEPRSRSWLDNCWLDARRQQGIRVVGMAVPALDGLPRERRATHDVTERVMDAWALERATPQPANRALRMASRSERLGPAGYAVASATIVRWRAGPDNEPPSIGSARGRPGGF
jgi:hypothetical protein